MKENSTRPLLLLYAYNECNLPDGDAAQRMIDGDPIVAAAYKELVEDISRLDAFVAEPSAQTISNILSFAALPAK